MAAEMEHQYNTPEGKKQDNQAMEQFIRDLIASNRDVLESNRMMVQTDHDLLIATNAVMKQLYDASGDHEKRLRSMELKIYMGIGALSFIELIVGAIAVLK